MRGRPFSLGRSLFGTLLGHWRLVALKFLDYFGRWFAASWDASRLARRLTRRVMACPTGVPPSTRTFLGAPPTPRFGVSEAKLQTPGAKMRRGNEMGCLTEMRCCLHPEERACASASAKSNARARVSKHEDASETPTCGCTK